MLPVVEVFRSFREQRNGQLMSLVRIFCFVERSEEWKIRLGLWLMLEVSGFEQRKLVKLALIGVEVPVKLWVDEEDDWLMTLLNEPKGGLLELVRMAVGFGKWCSESGLEMEAIE